MKNHKLLQILIFFLAVIFSGCGQQNQKTEPAAAAPEKPAQFLEPDGLNHYYVSALFNDNKGTLWIGTRKGLNIFRDGKIQKPEEYLDLRIGNRQVNHITGNSAGDLYFATDSGLVLLRNGQVSAREAEKCNFVLWQDSKNTLYTGTEHGILTLKNGQWNMLDADNSGFDISRKNQGVGDFLLSVLCLFEDQDKILWAGTKDGLVKMENETSFKVFYGNHKIPSADGSIRIEPGNSELPGNIVNRILFEGSEGWVATGSGAARFSGNSGNWDVYTAPHMEGVSRDGVWKDEKVPGNSPLIGNWVTDIRKINGWICFATTKGISFFHHADRKWKHFTSDDGLSSERITCIEVFNQMLVAGSEYGMTMIPLSDLLPAEKKEK